MGTSGQNEANAGSEQGKKGERPNVRDRQQDRPYQDPGEDAERFRSAPIRKHVFLYQFPKSHMQRHPAEHIGQDQNDESN